MAEARNRGAVVSSLFRTAPGLYRSLGYEEVAELIDGTYPTSSLRAVRPETATLRRATKADGTAIRSVYAAVAAAGSCLLTRDGPAFGASDEELIGSFDGITLAEEPDGTVVGYASWDRGHGYGDGAALSVADLLATSVDGYRALLAAIASFESVTPTVAIRTSGTDPVHWLVPASGWTVASVRQYMLRILDLPAAIAARGWPATAVADVVLDIEDTSCPWNNGRHRLVVQNGFGSIDGIGPTTRKGHTAGEVTTISARGLAVLYAGGVPVATLRRAGLLSGGSAASDSALDAVFAGPRPAILDYF
jgi:predicted acetyltransferase